MDWKCQFPFETRYIIIFLLTDKSVPINEVSNENL